MAVAVSIGCAPSGPRLLLKGERLIQEEKYVDAAEKLEGAVRELPQNAQAWNHLGLAYHHTGSYHKAAQAYQQALNRDRNLSAARYNLGCLEFDQRNYPGAIDALTTYVSLQPQSLEGWLKLGNAQLRLAQQSTGADKTRQLDVAKRSFENVLRLGPSPDAHNALGVIQVLRSRPREAVANFTAALQQQPGYAPAMLNLAVVHHQYLNDRKAALQEYHDYIALHPQPDAARDVQSIVQQLDAEFNPPARTPLTNLPPVAAAMNPMLVTTNPIPRLAATNAGKIETNLARVTIPLSKPIAPTAFSKTPTNTTPARPARIEVAQLPEDPEIKPARDVATATTAKSSNGQNAASAIDGRPDNPSVKGADRPGFLQKMNPANWFGKKQKSSPPLVMTIPELPARTNASFSPPPATRSAATPTAATAIPPKPVVARYRYRLPSKPAAGNRRDAEKSFADGVQAHRDGRFPEAIQSYRRATQVDPTFFEAYYNLGLAGYDAGDAGTSLLAYEYALVLKPDSVNARYNFALALQKANYPQDAAEQLERLLEEHPAETRAHLSLANLYAQQLFQPQLARQHYLKVIEAEPRHPQATAIRYWLAANP